MKYQVLSQFPNLFFCDAAFYPVARADEAEANQLKATIAEWMQTHLGLTLNQDKTQITHRRKTVRFLGYELEGRTNPNGTGWVHLGIPKMPSAMWSPKCNKPRAIRKLPNTMSFAM